LLALPEPLQIERLIEVQIKNARIYSLPDRPVIGTIQVREASI
jgi:hypothetical protein